MFSSREVRYRRNDCIAAPRHRIDTSYVSITSDKMQEDRLYGRANEPKRSKFPCCLLPSLLIYMLVIKVASVDKF